MLTCLSTWLGGKLRSGEIDRLWLLARHSEGLSQIMPLLCPDLADRIHYLCASRPAE